MLEKFAEVHLGDEIDTLDAADRKVVENAIEAARALDAIFWKQTWSGAVALRDRLAAANDRRRLEEVLLMYGPYDRLEDHRPFLDNVPTRPQGAAFYPDDMTREEFERWIADHPEDREAFESLTSLIRRDGDRLVATPYRTAFQDELGRAADALRAAADASTNESLATYLRARAEALLSDEYYESDLAWMDVENNSVDVTIGPYETYEDMLFGYKAAYEAYVGVVDAQESANLQTYARYLDDMDKKLAALCPYNIHRGAASPIRVINLIYNAGDARAGVQTTAFNLPNDERVHQARGTRKVMLRNVARAKFQKSMIPLAERLLASSDLGHVTFNAYFTNVLLHEMSHSLGPSFIGFNGTQTTVRKALKDQYSAVEEAKADIGGLYFHQWLIDQGVLPESDERPAYTSFLAGFFRSIRFGRTEAHGRANIVELNYLQERGGIRHDAETGRYSVDFSRIRGDVEALAKKLIELEAMGDYQAAKSFMEKYDKPTPAMEAALQRVEDVPVDILPRFRVEQTVKR